jgi:hypothetical protein
MIPTINALEKSILKSAAAAQREYKTMTGGWWLWHGPESFLQVVVAQRVAKTTGHSVYVDTSRKRIECEKGRGRERRAANQGQRPDISVWNKTSARLRAVIEIKRTNTLGSIQADATRMSAWLRQANPPSAAYILAYSLSWGNRRTSILTNRFRKWESKTSWKTVGSVVFDAPDDPDCAWGIILMRNPVV